MLSWWSTTRKWMTRAMWEILFPRKAASSLKGQELEHVYTLLAKKDGLAGIQCNGRIQGMSLKANVADIAGTKVQIGIQGDENKDRSGYRWFDFATVYS